MYFNRPSISHLYALRFGWCVLLRPFKSNREYAILLHVLVSDRSETDQDFKTREKYK